MLIRGPDKISPSVNAMRVFTLFHTKLEVIYRPSHPNFKPTNRLATLFQANQSCYSALCMTVQKPSNVHTVYSHLPVIGLSGPPARESENRQFKQTTGLDDVTM